MLSWIHRNLPIVLAAALSLLIHMAVLFPLIEVAGLGRHNGESTKTSLGRAMPGLKGPTRDLEREKAKERRLERERQMQRKLNIRRMQREEEEKKPEELKAEEAREEKVELGIDESDAVTMNWIGYAEYEKHLAALSEVEQAALRLETSSGAGGTASPTLPPAPPSATVAMSPNPSDVPLPASAGGPDLPQETTLLAPGSVDPASPPVATAATEKALVAGSDAERARPAQPPEQDTDARAKPIEGEKSPERAPAEEQLPPAPKGNDPTVPPSPDAPRTDPDAGATTAPKPVDPKSIDPKADPTTNPAESPDPSEINPAEKLDPTKPGASDVAPPRENADPTLDSPKPPLDAPTKDGEASAAKDRTEQAAPGEGGETDQTAPNAAGGGIKGPEVVNGAASVPTPPSPAGSPGDARADDGALSNRESDASSIIDVPMRNWQNGKPLARKGITLQTFRPKFNTLNIIDGIAFNPIVELVIGRDGVPRQVVIARSSGNPSVNEAIRAALFKWRATGKQVEQLQPGKTITIRLKLIMLQD